MRRRGGLLAPRIALVSNEASGQSECGSRPYITSDGVGLHFWKRTAGGVLCLCWAKWRRSKWRGVSWTPLRRLIG